MKMKFSRLLSFILVLSILANTFSPITVLAVDVIDDINENQVQEEKQSKNQETEKNSSPEEAKEGEENTEKSTTTNQPKNFSFSNQNELYSEIFQQKTILNNIPNNNIIQMEDVKTKGNIEVETHLVLPIVNSEKNNMVFTIYDSFNNNCKIDLNKVNEPSDGYYEENIKLGDQNIRVVLTERDKDGNLLSGIDYQSNVVYISINLYSLDKGNYTIELSGNNFVTYKIPVTLNNFSKRITFSDEAGMFEIGDINSDGKVNQQDADLMLQKIETGDTKYDLNLDGNLDIADLNYITAIMLGTKGKYKEENTDAIVNSENISFEVPKDVLVEGSSNLSGLFTDDGVVKLKQIDNNPIELGIDLSGKEKTETVEMSEIRIKVGSNAPKKMKLLIQQENGQVLEKEVEIGENQNKIYPFTDRVDDGILQIDLGKQIAVKKVTIVITETSDNNLADIAKVEFLNNVKVKTKEPDNFYTPDPIKVDGSKSEQLTISFDSVPNVTGYEIEVVGPKMNQVFQTTYTTFTVEDLKNYATYKIRVQSTNQEWNSGWSKVYEGIPQANRKPPKVDMVKAVPTYSGIDFSWKDMDDTESYKLYYRKKDDKEFTLIDNIEKTSYSLKGLEASTIYEAYILGVNRLGQSESYTLVSAKTLEVGAAIVPKYFLINDEYDQTNKRTTHIENVQYSTGEMTNDNPFSIVDDDFSTYWSHNDWQISAHTGFNTGAPVIVLDNAYEMNEFVITVPDGYKYNYKSGGGTSNDIKVHYWESEQDKYTNTNRKEIIGTLSAKYDSNNRKYYVLKLDNPIKAKAVSFALTVANNGPNMQIDEVKFYKYDSLVDDVAKLFTDDLRIELADGVDQNKINDLKARANKKDHDEYSPYRDSILADLEYAEKILKDEKIDDIITLNPNISNYYNGHLKFAMTINDYQPLGIVAKPGETLNVYIGTKGKVNAEIIFTQYHAEAGEWNKTYTTKALTKGLNIITVPTIGSSTDERGGSVYIRYNSKPDATNPIKVRVSGGTKIPMVDTTLLEDDASKKEAIKTYINNLISYNDKLNGIYEKEGSTFNKQKSVLGSTEIVTKYGLLSVSSVAVEDALNSVANSLEDKVNRLFESTEAFDEMMEFFYRQKGLKENPEDLKDAMPKSRINIRYMQMFDGAFMYAGGYHIGIEYGSIAGLIQAHRNSDTATGYFGWGISHEIGHQINQSSTAYAEVTNNIYALLAQTSNDNDKSRLETSNIYQKIYEKVTSHTLGRAQNVFVQLGMYWQLHLAYDENKTFMDNDSIYSKINHISRTYDNSKKLSRDELTIVYACKAANKDLSDFFKAWGFKITDNVKEEIESLELEKETRPIYYLNDSARRYVLSNQEGIKNSDILTANMDETDNKNKRVTLSFNVTESEASKILGYEILRNGESIGFVEGDTHSFTDNIGAENNRAYTYQVVAYDYLLNKTNVVTLNEVKISHDGSVKKDNFTITSNVKEAKEIVDNEDEDVDFSKLHVNRLIDGDTKTGFKGTEKIKTLNQNSDKPSISVDNGDAYVIINLNNSMSVSGIKYRALVENGTLADNTINKYKIYVSSDGEDWSTVAKVGTFNVTAEKPEEIVYFMGKDKSSESQLWTYNNISYIKIESVGNKAGLSGAEIDVIAPPGDNVDISMQGDNPVIGVLETDYCYLTDGCDPEKLDEDGNKIGIIDKDSVIIQGTYRGSPSFNTILIGDSNNIKKNYSGYQLIFAEVNDDMTVYEVAEGTFLYVMTKDQYENMIKNSSSIRAYLYRVNDAITNDGQRLTSTSKNITNLKPYDELQKIDIKYKN